MLIGISIAALAVAALIAGLIAFGTAAPPEVTAAMRAPFDRIDYSDLPASETFRARDGAALAYRHYPAAGSRVTVLVHGAAGASKSMHLLAKALRGAGSTVYALDMRGRGASRPNGDIAYAGQLDDDLEDLSRMLRARHPGADVTLAGYSSGGGYVLRVAGGRIGSAFDAYALISPYLGHRAPTQRPTPGGWTKPFVPRLIGLAILDRIGIHALEGLPVIALAPVTGEEQAPTSSYRLARNFHPNDSVLEDFRRAPRPMAVLVGEADEVLYADRFAPLIAGVRPEIGVTIVPGVDHIGIITDPRGAKAVAAVLGERAAAEAETATERM